MTRRFEKSQRVGRVVAASLWLVAASSATVWAQKVVIAPPAAGESAQAAARALEDGLRMQGLTVIMFDQKQAVAPDEHCDTGSDSALEGSESAAEACAARLLQAVSADFSATVELSKDERNGPRRVRVTLQDDARHRYAGEAEVRDGDVREATTRALLDARAYQLLGPGPWLRIDGTPEGADVLVDGNLVGKLPYRACITPGQHRVVVRDAGYARFAQTIDVPAYDTRKVELKVALEPAVVEAPSAELQLATPVQEQPQERSSLWLAGPITMEVLGVGLATALTVRLASGLQRCVDPDEQARCVAQRSVNVWPTAAGYALSAALIGAGVVWLVLGSERESPRVAAQLGIDHIAVSGSF